MSEQNLQEVWQVEVNGTVYEAPFHELGGWIDGGSLLPEDKVRKGNLRWIEARRVPSLVPFFNAKANGQPMPILITETVAEAAAAPADMPASTVSAANPDPVAHDLTADPGPSNAVFDPEFCAAHRENASFYLCDGCGHGHCKACPKSYGGTVKICPLCGALCRPKSEVKGVNDKFERMQAAVDEGFGIADLFSALGHPFRYRVSLIFGAILFMMFTLGKGAGALGGIFMMVGAIFSGMCANALTFGVLAQTIDNFIQGKLDENFMPEFEDFSLWDDVIHPFFLSIAAYLSSCGPFFLVLAISVYLIVSSVGNTLDSYKGNLEKIPGTNVYSGRKLSDQTGEVKRVLKDIDQKQMDRMSAITDTAEDKTGNGADAETKPIVDEEAREQEELWAMATENRKASLESAIGKSPETEAQEQAAMFQAFLNLAAPLVVVAAITFLWGLFLFPASCAVAGYSRTFAATINPLVALDTIKRLGIDYVKILGMGLVLLFLSLLVGVILGAVFSVFNMPAIGNLPATAIGAMFTFYLWAVFSCILGYALFKNADKLGLVR